MKRRRVALLIRARQELWKRLERWMPQPTWRGPADTLALLDERAAARLSSPAHPRAGPPAVAEWLRADSSARYPLSHLRGRDPRSLADAGRVVAEAERLLTGDWAVLGQPIRVAAETIDWRAHPLTATGTPLRHFSRVSYAPEANGGDVKFLWEMNRHAELVRLAQAYWLTEREEFAHGAIALLERWLDQNPPGFGINWVSCLDVAFRTIAWCWVWQLTSRSHAWSDARVARLLWSVAHAGRFIARYDSVHHSPNTHLTGEALGLVYIGTVFPALRDSARWRRLGIRILREEAGEQFLADGMHYERSTGYHRYHVEFYLHALAMARAAGETWAEPFAADLARGMAVSLHLRRPDGTWPVLGDEDGGATVRLGTRDATDQSELLVAAASLLDRPELRAGTPAGATPLAWWLLDDAAWRRAGEASCAAPAATSASFSHAGYHVARDDWSEDAWYCVVDAGPHGGDVTGHAHSDLGHVEIACGRDLVVVDAGSAVYTGAPARRDWFRGPRAHAGVTIDDVELAAPGLAFDWKTVAPTPCADAADRESHWYCRLWYSYPTPRGPVTHERQVLLLRRCGVIVCDLVDGAGPHAITVRWPLAGPRPEWRSAGGNGSCLSVGTARISWASSVGAATVATTEPTRRSPTFGVEVDAAALVLTLPAAPMPGWAVTAFTTSTGAAPAMSPIDGGVAVQVIGSDERRMRIEFRRGMPPSVLAGDAVRADRR